MVAIRQLDQDSGSVNIAQLGKEGPSHHDADVPSTSGMKNPRHKEPDEPSPGPFRKQRCREDTWKEVVRTHKKSDWLMQLNAIIPSIPELDHENNERDTKKSYYRPKSVGAFSRKEIKDAI